jgi:hypothetical protein
MNWSKIHVFDLIILILICVLMGSFGQIYMKKGLKESGGLQLNQILSPKFFSIVFQPHVFTGLALYIGASVLWLVVLSRADVSFVYPMIALGYIITAMLAKFYFPIIGLESENITLIRWMGIILILGGVSLITRS